MGSGKAKVEVDGMQVAMLKAGDFFGEVALLRGEARSATIAALEKTVALKITRSDFNSLGLLEKLEFPKRAAVGGGDGATVAVQPPSPKVAEDRQLISDALKANMNLAKCIALDESKINAIIDKMWCISVPAGEAVIKQGDID